MNILKYVLIAAIAVFALSSRAPAASPEADIKKMVETFYSDYMRFNKNPPEKDYDAHLIAWVKASPYTSPGFKKVLAKTVRDALKHDPELGLESDPILAGQDYPKKGYHAKKITVTNDKATVLMEGIDDTGFHIPLELINLKGQWLIDGIRDIKASTK